MGKASDLSDFDRGTIVGARRGGASVSETAALLGFSCTTVSRVYREWSQKQKTSSQRKLCGRKRLVNETGEKIIDTIIKADRMATHAEITAIYNSSVQKSISKHTTRRILKRMGYKKTVPASTSAKNRKVPAQSCCHEMEKCPEKCTPEVLLQTS
ncbi:hypothetical protein COCON_G00131840 [Conger conger]|uniref:Transposase Tc1-like domain-containing protein n=1 Tax=Conger conger TaxID=82655 RepID=A0A9Q1DE11_CONCO|nr:hypothetical protein COCON_G00131840 [Conger conger]